MRVAMGTQLSMPIVGKKRAKKRALRVT